MGAATARNLSRDSMTLVAGGARVGGAVVRLTRSERALLGWLVANAGEPQSAERLLTEVWGYAPAVSSRTVATTVHRLRAKLEAHAGPVRLIRTVPGGYQVD